MKKIITLLALAFCLEGKGQIITTVAGTGAQGYSGDGGQATNAELITPSGIAFDAVGNMYIGDNGNNRIRVISTAGIITTKAGTGTSGYSGDGGQATAAEIGGYLGIITDSSGNLYIADSWNNRIRKINTLGIITTIVGNGIAGFSGDGGQATAAELDGPWSLTLDAVGNLYIADYTNNRIRKVNSSGIITTVAGNGTAGYNGDGGQATAAQIYAGSVALDAIGNLYISNSLNVRMVNTSGIIKNIAGNGSGAYSGDGGQATAAGLVPQGLILDVIGNLYIADNSGNCIRKVNTTGITGIISTIAGNGTIGFIGDGGQATIAELNYPSGISFDAIGNLYIADVNNNRVRKVCFSSCGNAGIEAFINNNQLNIYPNPNNGSFVIELNSVTKQTMQVYDVNGKMVLSQSLPAPTLRQAQGDRGVLIDASSLNEGVYNISLQSNEGVVNKRLVIVR